MVMHTLTEAEFHSFLARLDDFATQLAPRERRFLTTILIRATTNPPPDMLVHGAHADSLLHAYLTRALWEADRAADGFVSANPVPLPASGTR
jgi:hypothetical protein